jgi:hypothetical protein
MVNWEMLIGKLFTYSEFSSLYKYLQMWLFFQKERNHFNYLFR